MTTQRKILFVLLLSIMLGGATWPRAQEGAGAALTALDYAEIQQLYARYNHAIDGGDAETYASLFVPDGSFNNFNGHDALVSFIKNRKTTNLRHWNTNLMITGTTEGAKAAVYMMFVDVAARPPAITAAGKYEDTLVKTPQGWRFKKRVNQFEAPPAAPGAGAKH